MKSIVAEVYLSKRLLRKPSWRFRFLGNNNEIIGDEYNSMAAAIAGIDLLRNPNVAVWLRLPGRDDERIR